MLEILASRRDGHPLISAHRGASKLAPGNTMAAFEQAWQLGAPMIELDVQLSQDKHVVVIHDEQLQFTTNGHGPVHEHTLAELKALDAGAWYGPQFAGQRILTLDEVAAWSIGKTGLNIEIKGTATTLGDLPERVADICRSHGILDTTLVISFDHTAVLRVKEREPGLAGGVIQIARLVDPLAALQAAKANVILLATGFITPELCELAHDHGYGVECLVNDAQEAAALAAMGVDFIDTDYPDVIQAAIRSR